MSIRRSFLVGTCAFALTSILAGGTSGCGTEKADYEAAVAAGTAEAMSGFLEQHPDGMYAAKAKPDLDELDWKDAKLAETSAAYEQYIADHPDGIYSQEADRAAPAAAWREMDLSNDGPAIESFLEKYPHSAYATKAKDRVAVLKLFPDHLTIGETAIEPSEAGGWTISAPVENIGTVSVTTIEFRLALTGNDGTVLKEADVFLVRPAPKSADAKDEQFKPLKAGEKRSFKHELAPDRAPKGWVDDADHVRLVLSGLTVAEG